MVTQLMLGVLFPWRAGRAPQRLPPRRQISACPAKRIGIRAWRCRQILGAGRVYPFFGFPVSSCSGTLGFTCGMHAPCVRQIRKYINEEVTVYLPLASPIVIRGELEFKTSLAYNSRGCAYHDVGRAQKAWTSPSARCRKILRMHRRRGDGSEKVLASVVPRVHRSPF